MLMMPSVTYQMYQLRRPGVSISWQNSQETKMHLARSFLTDVERDIAPHLRAFSPRPAG
jgi:hypothetical protein